jgi:hypothetical protein
MADALQATHLKHVQSLVGASFPAAGLTLGAYILASDKLFWILSFFGKRIHHRLRRAWRFWFVGTNVLLFGALHFTLLNACARPTLEALAPAFGTADADAQCARSLRPLEHRQCQVASCVATLLIFFALWVDRAARPFLNVRTDIGIACGFLDRIRYGCGLATAWMMLADADAMAVFVLSALTAQRWIGAVSARGSWTYVLAHKVGVGTLMARVLAGWCSAQVRGKHAVAGFVAVSLL